MNLAFVTDGNLSTTIGILCTIQSLSEYSEVDFSEIRIWILAPNKESYEELKSLINYIYQLNTGYVNVTTRKDDKYYLQLGLINLFETLEPNDFLLALDYDHIVLDSRKIIFPETTSAVLVSSEIYHNLKKHLSEQGEKTDSRFLPEKHLNISMIFGKIDELRKIGKYWKQAYEDISSIISVRHRVEIGFSLAAKRANVIVLPCDKSFQGNFAVPNLNCFLFHYGGEFLQAKLMKNILFKTAESLANQSITLETIRETDKLLRQTLCSFNNFPK